MNAQLCKSLWRRFCWALWPIDRDLARRIDWQERRLVEKGISPSGIRKVIMVEGMVSKREAAQILEAYEKRMRAMG